VQAPSSASRFQHFAKTFLIFFLLACMPLFARHRRLNGTYLATAYSQTGITASGEYTHRHIVAADPDILPIGTRILIRHAGKYSGEYVVADTGGKIQGHRLDLYFPSTRECKEFGVKHVEVEVVELGSGTHLSAKQADRQVKQDVASDIARGAVGGAASEVDWALAMAPKR
jgi:3D (Asp-Asp-Asp) domain-containing protein